MPPQRLCLLSENPAQPEPPLKALLPELLQRSKPAASQQKAEQRDPVLCHSNKQPSALRACPGTPRARDRGRGAAPRIPAMARIPDATALGIPQPGPACSDAAKGRWPSGKQLQQPPVPPALPAATAAFGDTLRSPTAAPAPPDPAEHSLSAVPAKEALESARDLLCCRYTLLGEPPNCPRGWKDTFCLHCFQSNHGERCSDLFLPSAAPLSTPGVN